MKTIEAMVMSATDSLGDVEFLQVELSEFAELNIGRANKLFKDPAYTWIDCMDIRHNGTKLTAIKDGEVVNERFELFTLTVEASGTVLIKAWLKNDPEEYVNAEFTL